ncbi:GNAT family N-acetyltransferase [Agromyces sp. Soil535]|uniref:GNAT family N-acetyltransferase n=1 Tax=Agromyces sp. Soil535 TaxID=1736390 RepID=UPI0006F63623|nr:GNAT family N-acetyltransferase [Agromyces sp. Soil535]KRE23118.1 hypothetical protein ASG80_09745 [Agromyces sp. Soil535]
MRYRPATLEDLRDVQSIERAAGEAFRSIGMDEIADDAPIAASEFEHCIARGDAWIMTTDDGSPVAYLLLEGVDDALHVEQVTVHPSYARRGYGAQLLEVARRRSVESDVAVMTLTTFRDVPWNAPYYLRLGWTELPTSKWGPELAKKVESEAAHGLAAWTRVVMHRRTDD